jgi:hypothetical protein
MAPIRAETGIAAGRLREQSQRGKLAARVSNNKSAVLELDETGGMLSVWHWYVG